MTQPTMTAIETAARNAERDAKNYRIECGPTGLLWYVSHRTDAARSYIVAPDKAFCNCPAHEKMGVCKHAKMVDDHRALLAAEEAYENRHDCEMGKF